MRATLRSHQIEIVALKPYSRGSSEHGQRMDAKRETAIYQEYMKKYQL